MHALPFRVGRLMKLEEKSRAPAIRRMRCERMAVALVIKKARLSELLMVLMMKTGFVISFTVIF